MRPYEISIAFQTDKQAADYIALARQVNQYDFDAVTVYCDAPYQPSYGPLLLMAPYIERARIGPAAVSPSRMHPIDIAAQSALLMSLASGGVYVGLARGAWLAEHGITELKPPVRALREAVGVVRYLLSGETGGYNGQIYQLAAHIRAPYPLPSETLPLLIGTWGQQTCAMAGEIADEVKIGGSANPDVVPYIRDYIAVGERKVGREAGSVGVVVGAVTVVDLDRQAARQAARRSVALYLPVVAGLDPSLEVEPELSDRIQTAVQHDSLDEAAALISNELLDKFAFSGTPDDLIRQASALFEAGASRVEFGTPHGLSDSAVGIRLIGEQVLPALRTEWR
jgi:5,10-methylenetetrahydromethanopterin reductase